MSKQKNIIKQKKNNEIWTHNEKLVYSYGLNNENRMNIFCFKKKLGQGSFGTVFLGKIIETNEIIAIKKVIQDKKYKNRELQIMKFIKHFNIIEMKNYFYTIDDKIFLEVNNNEENKFEKKEKIFLNLILEYLPLNLYEFNQQYIKKNELLPLIYLKLFIFQLCKALNYLNKFSICHRDIKPQNILVDPKTGILKLCDFGCAKKLIPNEPNISYICPRYYRAPELIFEQTNYNCSIDIWAVGCIMGFFLFFIFYFLFFPVGLTFLFF